MDTRKQHLFSMWQTQILHAKSTGSTLPWMVACVPSLPLLLLACPVFLGSTPLPAPCLPMFIGTETPGPINFAFPHFLSV